MLALQGQWRNKIYGTLHWIAGSSVAESVVQVASLAQQIGNPVLISCFSGH